MSDWLTWQVVDSAFPTGVFAHSWGLEAAWQQGEVEGIGALQQFLEAVILQTGHATLPLLNARIRSRPTSRRSTRWLMPSC
jgi:urease accessory protein